MKITKVYVTDADPSPKIEIHAGGWVRVLPLAMAKQFATKLQARIEEWETKQGKGESAPELASQEEDRERLARIIKENPGAELRIDEGNDCGEWEIEAPRPDGLFSWSPEARNDWWENNSELCSSSDFPDLDICYTGDPSDAAAAIMAYALNIKGW